MRIRRRRRMRRRMMRKIRRKIRLRRTTLSRKLHRHRLPFPLRLHPQTTKRRRRGRS